MCRDKNGIVFHEFVFFEKICRNSFPLKMRELGPSNLKISGKSMNGRSDTEKHILETEASKMGEWLYDTLK